MNKLPKDIENIIDNFGTQLRYNDLIQEYKKKIQPKIRVYMNDNNIGISIDRFYTAKVNGKKCNLWGFFRFQDKVPLFSTNLTKMYEPEDLQYAKTRYEKIELYINNNKYE